MQIIQKPTYKGEKNNQPILPKLPHRSSHRAKHFQKDFANLLEKQHNKGEYVCVQNTSEEAIQGLGQHKEGG